MTGIIQPYKRIARPFVRGDYFKAAGGDSNSSYIIHPAFAKEPDKYVRSFLLLQNDLKRLFEYIEPTDANLCCYSFRIHEIIQRASIEAEANCKAILKENGYKKLKALNMGDYRKIEESHHLSAFQVKLPMWDGDNTRRPFKTWASTGVLPWYEAYNATKHDLHENFAQATFGHAVNAVCGVLVLLSAQFVTYNFDPTSSPFGRGDEGSSFWPAIGSYFTVKFPDNWPDDKRYSFSAKDWKNMKDQSDPFQQFEYPLSPGRNHK